MNLVAVAFGMTGFFIAFMIFLRRGDRDLLETFFSSAFVFIQAAMWGVEMFFIVTIILRLTGHGIGIQK